MRRLALATCLLCSCALAWQPTDGVGEKAAKLAARIPLGVVTLGISELVIAKESARERQWRVEAEKQARRDQLTAEVEHWKAAAIAATNDSDRQLALTFYQAAREDLAALDAPEPTNSGPAPRPVVIQEQSPKNCNSQVLNGQVFTHCE